MLPYIHVKDLPIGPLTLHPFGVLVAIGVVIGTWLATWRARRNDTHRMRDASAHAAADSSLVGRRRSMSER